MNELTEFLSQGIYINPQQMLIATVTLVFIIAVFIGMVIAFGKDRIDGDLD